MNSTANTTNTNTARTWAAIAMASAALLAIAGFTALGSIFEYPQILKEPTEQILALYLANQRSISLWFAALTVSAALLAPVGILLGRIAQGAVGQWIAGIGIAAAAVQVIGLSRWFLFVPGIAADAQIPAQTAGAQHQFEQLHFWLGTIVGETIGYALTATFTVLVIIGVTRKIAGAWLAWLGYAAAGLIATGVLIPMGLSMASLTNFGGYVLWCLWLIAMAVMLVRSRTSVGPQAHGLDSQFRSRGQSHDDPRTDHVPASAPQQTVLPDNPPAPHAV